MAIEAGLYYASPEDAAKEQWSYLAERLVPLKAVHAEAVVVETTAEVKITQRYSNSYAFPIEAIYVFPLDEHAAVCEFEAEIHGKKIIGVVKEKEQAQAEYTKAIQQGHGAYLLEQGKPDIFRARVGNIPPGVEVSISIKYVAEMKCEMEKVRFLLPTYVAPRYSPAETPASDPAFLGASPPPFSPYLLSLKVTAISAAGFASIESPSHAISKTIHDNVATIELDHGVTELNKDFLVMLTYNQPHEPKVVLEDDGKGSYAAMVTLFPHLEFADVKNELIFVVDRSGSMDSKVRDLREAMELFMRSLPDECYFNIVGFGSDFMKLFPESKPYNDDTLQAALDHINTLEADLGGTELLEPLQDIFKIPTMPGCPRQVFVLTDGQISNTEQVISLVQQNNKQSRLFALGIGDSVSHHLVEGLARAGKGTSFFVMENERMEKKILKQLKDATQPALNEVKVNWGVGSSKKTSGSIGAALGAKVMSLFQHGAFSSHGGEDLQQAPFTPPPVFSDEHFRIYAVFPATKLPEKVCVEAKSPDGILRVELPVNPKKVIKGNLLHTLAGRSLIRDLEEGRSHLHAHNNSPSAATVKAEIVRLGLKYTLTSKYTSFLAIEERDKSSRGYDCFHAPPPPEEEKRESASYGGSGSPKARRLMKKSAPKPMKNAAMPPPAPTMLMKSASAGASPPPPPTGAPAPPSAAEDVEGSAAPRLFVSSAKRKEKKVAQLEYEEEEKEMEAGSESADEDDGEIFDEEDQGLPLEARMEDKKTAPSAPSQALSPRARMSNLLALQSTKGDYSYSEKLAAAIGLPLATLSASLSTVPELAQIQDIGIRERFWATVLALTFLKKKLSSLADEWELVDKKARKWLAAQGVAQLDDIFAAASSLIV